MTLAIGSAVYGRRSCFVVSHAFLSFDDPPGKEIRVGWGGRQIMVPVLVSLMVDNGYGSSL
jgi:hypothetical protein